jgi:vacuolar-type H+-ATPase subunit E/Vma4
MPLTTGPGRTPRRAQGALRVSLRVVEAALLGRAQGQARAVLEGAQRDADDELQRTRAAIPRLLEQARDEGHAAAAYAGESTIAQARSDARALVLSAERRAYEALRRGAIEELARRAAGRDGVDLRERIAALVVLRLGEPTTTAPATGTTGLWVAAGGGGRQASVSVEALVDRQLAAMATEVAQLWS